MPRPEWRDADKETYWRRVLEQWRRSGLSGRAFCVANSLSEPSFYAWKGEIARRDREGAERTKSATAAARTGRATAVLPAFVPVTLDAVPAAAGAASLEVVLAGGRLLRVRGAFDSAVLRQLLVVLEAAPC